jgi:flagella basal body P-ring formation protein FlgA
MGMMLRTFRLTAVAALALGSIPAACSATEAVADSPDVAAARAELLHRLHQARPDLDRIELAVIGPAGLRTTEAASGSRVIPANAAVQSNTLARRMCVWVRRRRAGRSAGSVPVWFSVQAFRSVLVTQRRRNARESLVADDLAVEEQDVAAFSAIPLALDTDLARVRMRRSVSTGHVLLQGDLEEVPPILEGQEVVVEVTQGAVAIQTRAVALREARLGERVTLQNPTSHETYTAQVVGTGRAEVVDR